jgi:C4-dicarboxylate transporter DctQ subunit
MIETLYRWHMRLSECAAKLAAAGLALSIVSYSVETVARYGFNAPLNWSGDLGAYLLCGCIFLALPQITAKKEHIVLDILIERLGRPARRRYVRLIAGLCALICFVAAAIVTIEGKRQFDHQILTSTANQIPKWWLSAAVIFGLFGAAVHLVKEAVAGDLDPESDAGGKG